MLGGGGGVPLLAGMGTRGVTAEKGTMSKTSVDWGFMERLPPCLTQTAWNKAAVIVVAPFHARFANSVTVLMVAWMHYRPHRSVVKQIGSRHKAVQRERQTEIRQ